MKNDSKYTINPVFNLHDPLDTVPLSKVEIEKIFLPNTEKFTLELLQKHQNLDPVVRQLISWYKYKTKPIKADTVILENKTLLRYFKNFDNTSINDNTDILECQTFYLKVLCLSLSMMLIAFHTSHTLHTKGHSGSEKKHTQISFKISIFQVPKFGLKYYARIALNVNKINPIPTKNKLQKNKVLKDKVYISITDFHSIQKDQYHHPQKETH